MALYTEFPDISSSERKFNFHITPYGFALISFGAGIKTF